MCTKNLDLLFLTETWLSSNVIDPKFCPLGYNITSITEQAGEEALLLYLKT